MEKSGNVFFGEQERANLQSFQQPILNLYISGAEHHHAVFT